MSRIICLSGKKQSGKNTSGHIITGIYLKHRGAIDDFNILDNGWLEVFYNRENHVIKDGEFNHKIMQITDHIKMYSFADPLKQFCMDVFGLTYEQCYGTDEQKDSLTQIKWWNLPLRQKDFIIQKEIIDKKRSQNLLKYKSENLTARQILQYFGTEIVRSMFGNAWVNATINKIKRDNPIIAIITDGRFPNEIDGINSVGGKTIRLLRDVSKDYHPSEIALDSYPLEKYSLVIDNNNMTISEQQHVISKWMNNEDNKMQ